MTVLHEIRSGMEKMDGGGLFSLSTQEPEASEAGMNEVIKLIK